MNCRDFINEFEERSSLTESARLHLNDCPDCLKTSATQTRIWQAVDGFAKIEAPKSFEFAVKAKIAKTKPAGFAPQFLPVLRYVLPLSAIVLVLGLLAFNTSFFFGDNNNSQVAEVVAPAEKIGAQVPLNGFVPAAPIVENNKTLPTYPNDDFIVNAANSTVKPVNNRPGTQFVAVKSNGKVVSEPRRKTDRTASDNGGGSVDTAVTQPKILTPEGFNPSNIDSGAINKGNLPKIENAGIWSLLGIELVTANGDRVVNTVKSNSLADRSGIKTGDVIQAVDGVKFVGSPVMESGKFEVKSLTILRGTEQIVITLKK